MLKSAKSRAEEQFTATQKKDKQALQEKEKAKLDNAEKTARLKALRLAAKNSGGDAAAPDDAADSELDSAAPTTQTHRR